MIPYGRQDINEDDIQSVISVLKSDFLTQGPMVPKFEKRVTDYCGVAHAFAMNSATSALHVACKALELSEGDWLWTTPISFVASSNCALYCGAKVDFVDIDPGTFNLSVDRLKKKLIQAKATNKLPKVVIPVHLCGQPCDMEEIFALSKEYGFKIIEDASHAIGAKYKNSQIGDCQYSHITVFSFHPVKIITTAEGGMACTNDPELARKIELLRSHGITRNPELMSKAPDGPWYYEQVDLGYNYRMTDLQAALGVTQFPRLDTFIERRQEIACKYDDAFKGLPLTAQNRPNDRYSSLHLYVIRLKNLPKSRTHISAFEFLRENGVGVNLHYIPIYRQPYYQQFGYNPDAFPEAEKYYSEAISLPMFPALSEEQHQNVIQIIRQLYQS